MRFGLGRARLRGIAVLAVLAFPLVCSGCASTKNGVAATDEAKSWGRCDRSRLVNVTFVCYQR